MPEKIHGQSAFSPQGASHAGSKGKEGPAQAKQESFQIQMPSIALPKGGGALKGIDEKFQVNAANGTAGFSIPLPVSPGRNGFQPALSLSYNSGSGNSAFGLGWSVDLPAIQRKTDKQLPGYREGLEEDVFTINGAEDLVPYLIQEGDNWITKEFEYDQYHVKRYRPRTEGDFAKIEKITHATHGMYWRITSKDNIVTIYGRSEDGRIADPEDGSRIFRWLPEFSYDNKGAWISYTYKKDDNITAAARELIPNHLYEKNRRNGYALFVNRYLKSVCYGNRSHYTPHHPFNPEPPLSDEHFFTLIFDYGDHDVDQSSITEPGGADWNYREDAFSDYRSGFEIRTARLCKRVLLFHQFAELGTTPCLVKALHLGYQPSSINQSGQAEVTYLQSVTQTSHIRKEDGTYASKSLPPMEFFYQQLQWSKEVKTISTEDGIHAPVGLMPPYQWTDFWGEGISGIFTEQGGEWFYKSNLGDEDNRGNIRFSPAKIVAPKPSFTGLNAGVLQFQDLESNGQRQVVTHVPGIQGYFELTENNDWEPFSAFEQVVNIDLRDPNLRAVDLNGDGKPELLISEETVWVWYASAGKKGYDAAAFTAKILDEEKGPAIVFADSQQTIYLADLNGDGLTDIVRIRNGEICYWANKGYGRFSAKIAMGNAPWFDLPDQFNPEHIHLADMSGTGATDILYTGRSSCKAYLNLSGNAWSDAHPIETFPAVTGRSQVAVVDLLGSGTPCLVWSSDLAHDEDAPMKWIDLMGSKKPHILMRYINNFGKETSIQYKSSTHFYLKDKREGKPWITRLPFPVQVVQQTTVTDKFTKTSFGTSYSYHHGYYDHAEREFRGFGRVEQVDTENYGTFSEGNRNSPYITVDQTLYQPPVKTITWFHTGAFLNRKRILAHFQEEYFQPASPGFYENPLPEPDLEIQGLSPDEWQEALRACKGMTLRQEVYELDAEAWNTRGQPIPVRLFNTGYHNCHVQRLQPKGNNPHAVFLVTESEAITYQYELDLRAAVLHPDPRITHTLNVQTDEWGHVLQSVAAVYPRIGRHIDASLPPGTEHLIAAVQQERHLVYTENCFTNDINDINETDTSDTSKLLFYRVPLPCEVSTYELTGIEPAAGIYFSLAAIRNYQLSDYYAHPGAAVQTIQYHQLASRTAPQKRLVEQVRTLYFHENLTDPLPLRSANHVGLPFENYKLALTEGLIHAVLHDKLGELRRTGEDDTALLHRVLAEGGYHFLDNLWWIRSGIAGFERDAAAHFYLPERFTDPFGNTTTLLYDPYDLYIRSSTDPVGNTTEVVQFDFRVLAPKEIRDINNNLSELVFDILGMPAAMALKGKGTEGDNLAGYSPELTNLTLDETIRFFTREYDEAEAQRLLGNATVRNHYYLGEEVVDGIIRYGRHPACAATLQREKHAAGSASEVPLIQAAFAYSNGSGGVMVTKQLAEPETGSAPLRWIASGKTVLNNKGKPVKQYEAYFSAPEVAHRFEEPHEAGVTPVMYYDAAGRLMRTEMPDGSYSRVEFTPWYTASFDQSDTLLEEGNAWYAARMLPTASVEDREAADKAAVHASTPAVTCLDSLGREVIAIAHNRYKRRGETIYEEKYVTFTKLDAEGKPLWIRDARGNLVMQYVKRLPPAAPQSVNQVEPTEYTPAYDIAGNLLFQHSMDAGDRWMLTDSTGQPLYAWDSHGNITHMEYDLLRRPAKQWLKKGVHADRILVSCTQYGDDTALGLSNDTAGNLRGKAYRSFDPAGMMTHLSFDFKGNLLEAKRRLAAAYNEDPDWSPSAGLLFNHEPEALLMPETFRQTTEYDALNRMTRQENWHLPDRLPAVYRPRYNRRGLLEAERLTIRGVPHEAIVVISYDAKGQKERIRYGNGTVTRYDYHPQTFRLLQLRTTRPGYEQPYPDYHANLGDNNVLQQLNYTYDPAGNITEIHDEAYETAFFRNQEVKPRSKYTYDALYRLIKANGRENYVADGAPGQVEDRPFAVHFPVDTKALRNYIQNYKYDSVGNIVEMKHIAHGAPGVSGSWTRHYTYEDDNNRLHQTWTGNDTIHAITYHYNEHGSMYNLDNTATELYMQWDYRDMIASLNMTGGGRAYYTYDAQKQRTRKRLDRGRGLIDERLYVDGMELYRRYENNIMVEEVETHHLFEGSHRVLLVEDIIGQSPSDALLRYQYSNHLGSVGLELDGDASIISYEEFHPYGTTAYRAGRNAAEVSMKRYRYTGMERDRESGLNYHGARYYAGWLGRWVSGDPVGIKDGLNIYNHVRGAPVNFTDINGRQASTPSPLEEERSVSDDQLHNMHGPPSTPIEDHSEAPPSINVSIVPPASFMPPEGPYSLYPPTRELTPPSVPIDDPLIMTPGGTYRQSELPRVYAYQDYMRYRARNANVFTQLFSATAEGVARRFTNDPQVISAAGDLGTQVGNIYQSQPGVATIGRPSQPTDAQPASPYRGRPIRITPTPRPRGRSVGPPSSVRTGVSGMPLVDLPNVNTGQGEPMNMNCGPAAVATDARLRGGRPTVATFSGETMTPRQLAQAFFPGRRFSNLSQAQLESRLLQAGHGATGIVYGRYSNGGTIGPSSGHFFNAINWRGRIFYLDGQSGRVISNPAENYTISRFLRTR